jgi:hypothetical protein
MQAVGGVFGGDDDDEGGKGGPTLLLGLKRAILAARAGKT